MPDHEQAQPDEVILRASQIRSWKSEQQALLAQRQSIDEKLANIERKLAAVAVLTGEAAGSLPNGSYNGSHELEAASEDGAENMAQATKRIIASCKRPPRNAEIIRALKKMEPHGERLRKNPNYYYTMIGRLVRRNELIKSGDVYRLPQEN